MMVRALVTAGVLAASGAAGAAGAENPLARYRWSSRLVVISAPAAGDPRVEGQRRILAAATPGMRDRDLTVVEAIGDGAKATAIRRSLDLPPDAFRAVLVGKDGGAKLVRAEPIPADVLFEIIDAMPMRRQEAGERR